MMLLINHDSSLADDSSHQIVLLRFGNQDAHHLARHRHKIFGSVVNEHTAVNVGRLSLHSSLPQEITLAGFTFEKHSYSVANLSFVSLARNPRLLFHQTRATLFGDPGIDFIGQIVSRRSFFVRIRKYTDTIKLNV